MMNAVRGTVQDDYHVSLIDAVDLHAIEETMRKIATMQEVVRKTLKESHDYGVIPGVQKPSLLKPGGEKICMLFGLNPEYDFLSSTEDFEREFFSYNMQCTLYRNGKPCAQGVGCCNSREKKYRYIKVDKIPDGYVGFSEEITNRYGGTQYRIENPDVCSQVNTILKMAKKRAFIDAVLQVASLSEVFTQDIEDLQEFVRQEEKIAAAGMTPEQAGQIKVSFGKNKGKTLGQIYREDRSYLDWLLENAREDRIKTAIEIMYESVRMAAEAKKASGTSDLHGQEEPPDENRASDTPDQYEDMRNDSLIEEDDGLADTESPEDSSENMAEHHLMSQDPYEMSDLHYE